jgi:hypothetical protein
MDFPHKKTKFAPASVASASDFAPKSVGLNLDSETSGTRAGQWQAKPVKRP